jgi:hypothetical protein
MLSSIWLENHTLHAHPILLLLLLLLLLLVLQVYSKRRYIVTVKPPSVPSTV